MPRNRVRPSQPAVLARASREGLPAGAALVYHAAAEDFKQYNLMEGCYSFADVDAEDEQQALQAQQALQVAAAEAAADAAGGAPADEAPAADGAPAAAAAAAGAEQAAVQPAQDEGASEAAELVARAPPALANYIANTFGMSVGQASEPWARVACACRAARMWMWCAKRWHRSAAAVGCMVRGVGQPA